jgi:hypothetical protein
VFAYTINDYSDSVVAWTLGQSSGGVLGHTWGNYSDGVVAYTSGIDSDGVYAETDGPNSFGVHIKTSGTGSTGVWSETENAGSAAVYGHTTGDTSYGVMGDATGPNSFGVHAYSRQSHAIVADTGNSSMYGVYTPDKMSALGYDTNAGDVAEYMQVSDDVTPGTVLVIGKGGVLQPCTREYDTHVAGIVSTEPGVSLGKKEDGNKGEALIAVAGKVPCKVDHPTADGRDLQPSRIPGTMKATDQRLGLSSESIGTLEIRWGQSILVTLQ